MPRRVLVFGPAYLDRVLRVDRPLLPPDLGGPLDLSVGALKIGWLRGSPSVSCFDPEGGAIDVTPPEGWPEGGDTSILLDRPLVPGAGPWRREVRGVAWLDDLGGMGAGFASAMGGELVSALGPESDPMSAGIAAMLAERGIVHHPARVPDAVPGWSLRPSADWTLLVTSGPHGDKLPIGFRGCHAALSGYPGPTGRSWDVLVVASLTNRLVASALDAVDAAVRVFAPTLRNMRDADPPIARFADRIDLLCCNRREWEATADREAVADGLAIVSITDGPAGGLVRYRDPSGTPREHREPAFPRSRPPRDTNRAGECHAATLLTTLLDAGWQPGPVDEDLVRRACRRASAAAALVIDQETFGFPTPAEVDRALDRGVIP